MRAYSDTVLSKILKNWVAQRQPPVNGRLKLLESAASFPRRRFRLSALIPRTQFNDYPIHTTNANEWTTVQFTWFFEQSFNAGFQARV
jgi:hypothetical protein